MLADHRFAPDGDRTQITHLLTRLQATLAKARTEVHELHKQIQKLSAPQTAGRPNTMNVEDAIRFTAPDVLARYVDGYLAEQLQELHAFAGDITAGRARLAGNEERLRDAGRALLVDSGVDEQTRERIARILRGAPTADDIAAITAGIETPEPADDPGVAADTAAPLVPVTDGGAAVNVPAGERARPDAVTGPEDGSAASTDDDAHLAGFDASAFGAELVASVPEPGADAVSGDDVSLFDDAYEDSLLDAPPEPVPVTEPEPSPMFSDPERGDAAAASTVQDEPPVPDLDLSDLPGTGAWKQP